MNELLELDRLVFFFINNNLSNAFFDALLPIWREKTTWIPVYLLLAVWLITYLKKSGWIILAATILTVGAADLASSRIMKPTFKRLRPCNEMKVEKTVIERAGCGRGYSFTSSHATNHFALSVFLILAIDNRFRRLKIPLILWAASIAFAQVYVGVHYPLDVLGGALLGSCIGWLGMITLARFFPNLFDKEPSV